MAKSNTPLIVLGVVVVAVLIGFGTGAISPQSLNIGQPAGQGGMQVPPAQQPSTGQEFAGQLTVNVVHRDALDNAEARTEGTNLVTTYYKSFDAVNFFTIGSGTGNTITIDSAQDSILYATVTVPSGQAFFVAPSSTADQNLNPRIIDFGFMDVNNDGTREWWFKMDLRDMPAPVAGQTASTLSLFVNSYDDGVSTLNAPANITAIGTASGVQNFIRWEQTVAQETVDPVYEYTINVDNENTEKWDRGQSNLDIPNIGMVALTDFDEQLQTSDTLYRFKVGATATLDNANYVTTAQNGNAVHPIAMKFVTNLATADNLAVTLTLKSLTSAQGTVSVSDIVNLLEA
jgi:hypothetical protein